MLTSFLVTFNKHTVFKHAVNLNIAIGMLLKQAKVICILKKTTFKVQCISSSIIMFKFKAALQSQNPHYI